MEIKCQDIKIFVINLSFHSGNFVKSKNIEKNNVKILSLKCWIINNKELLRKKEQLQKKCKIKTYDNFCIWKHQN